MRFEYVAFPVNKTLIETNGLIDIKTTTFYGLIDYDNVGVNGSGQDYSVIKEFLDEDKWKFILSKLLVRFENSEIRNFKSYAFVKTPNLFENDVDFDGIRLSNGDDLDHDSPDIKPIPKLFRLKGNYQKNSNDADEFIFDIEGTVKIDFIDNIILHQIKLIKASFSYTNNENNDFRFDLDGDVFFNKDFGTFQDLISFDSISFKNIGLKFPLKLKLPKISFDVSKLLVLPNISFNGNGFLSSFPIKFNRFQAFNLFKDFKVPNFDFFPIIDERGHCTEDQNQRMELIFGE